MVWIRIGRRQSTATAGLLLAAVRVVVLQLVLVRTERLYLRNSLYQTSRLTFHRLERVEDGVHGFGQDLVVSVRPTLGQVVAWQESVWLVFGLATFESTEAYLTRRTAECDLLI